MPRPKTISLIVTEIAKKQELLAKVKNRYDVVAEELSALQEQKREIQSKEIMAAFIGSGKSYNEIMNFLDAQGR
jgi:cell fate (sporulation/competence/biofilm development) regulator YlbF (YheA/YmcA/DUF963 family)